MNESDIIDDIDDQITMVRTQSLDLSFNELADMYGNDELVIDPEFQRMFRWSTGAQSRFIESLVLELPLPPIFLIERENRVYELIDGLQRISSYLHFRGVLVMDGALRPPLELQDCDIVKSLNGLTADTIPRSLSIKLKRAFVRAEILRKESDPRLRYHMFKRLNTGGEILAPQEVRNATIRLLDTKFNDLLIKLSQDPAFSRTIDAVSSNQIDRKFDQELVLRFFAFKNARERYRHEIGDFLTDYMEEVSDPESESSFDYEEEEKVFLKTFAILDKIASRLEMGGRIFGSVVRGGSEPRGQFSVYHFEGITMGLQEVLSKTNEMDSSHIAALAEAVEEGKTDPAFIDYTGPGKNDANPLRGRINYFADKFSRALE